MRILYLGLDVWVDDITGEKVRLAYDECGVLIVAKRNELEAMPSMFSEVRIVEMEEP